LSSSFMSATSTSNSSLSKLDIPLQGKRESQIWVGWWIKSRSSSKEMLCHPMWVKPNYMLMIHVDECCRWKQD
jgi:hypothetical protein